MLRKGLLLLAISLSVSLAVLAQAPTGGGNTGGNTGGGAPGGTPGGGTPGGGTPGGTPGGGNPGGTPGGRPGNVPSDPRNNNGGLGQPQQQQQTQMERPIYLAGSVLLASGGVPEEPVLINRVCGTRKTPEGYTDSKGRFSFQVGGDQQLLIADASVGSQGPVSSFGGNGLSSDPMMGIDLTGCHLEAIAPGYRSDPILLTRRRPMDRPEVGTIILTPLGGVQMAAVSVTSLAAPKKAKESFEKGFKELGKGPSAKLDRAMADFQKAVDEYPEYAAAWNALGQAKAQSGDFDGAIVALEEALEADPQYLRPYEPLIRLYIRKGDWEHSAELAKLALGINPGDNRMRWFQALATFEAGRHDDALALLGEVKDDAEYAKQYPQTHQILGVIYAKRGQFGEAAEAYKRYLELDPEAKAAEAIKRQLYEWQQLGVI